jgi:integrase
MPTNTSQNYLRLVQIKPVHRQGYTLPKPWEDTIGGWLDWLRLSGLSEATLKLRRDHVRSIARRSFTQQPAELTGAQLRLLCTDRNWSREHRKALRTSLFSLFEYCLAEGLVVKNPATALPRVQSPQPRPRPAPDEVWEELLAKAPPRERLMALLAGEAGLRRAEIAVCHRDDLIEDIDGWALLVHGKGGRQRIMPLTRRLAVEIRQFCPRGYLFTGQIDGHISVQHVGVLISELMPEGWSLHKLRHRFATRAYTGTRNLLAVQEALGHASVATTQRYTAVSSREVRSVVEAAGRPTAEVKY